MKPMFKVGDKVRNCAPRTDHYDEIGVVTAIIDDTKFSIRYADGSEYEWCSPQLYEEVEQ